MKVFKTKSPAGRGIFFISAIFKDESITSHPRVCGGGVRGMDNSDLIPFKLLKEFLIILFTSFFIFFLEHFPSQQSDCPWPPLGAVARTFGPIVLTKIFLSALLPVSKRTPTRSLGCHVHFGHIVLSLFFPLTSVSFYLKYTKY